MKAAVPRSALAAAEFAATLIALATEVPVQRAGPNESSRHLPNRRHFLAHALLAFKGNHQSTELFEKRAMQA
jgi:hypothetical protein